MGGEKAVNWCERIPLSRFTRREISMMCTNKTPLYDLVIEGRLMRRGR